MTDSALLHVERELARVLARYARLADEREWSAIDEVFIHDASADYGGLQLPDRNAIVAMLQRALGNCGPSQHLLGNLTVDVVDGEVTSRVTVRAAHRSSVGPGGESYECMGEYHDRWVLTATGWRIAHRQMVVMLEFGHRRVLTSA